MCKLFLGMRKLFLTFLEVLIKLLENNTGYSQKTFFIFTRHSYGTSIANLRLHCAKNKVFR